MARKHLPAGVTRSILIAAITAVSSAGGRIATAATIGDPARPADLPAAVHTALDNGDHDVTLTPGTYVVPGQGKSLFDWKNLHDVTVHAAGVTIIADDVPEGRAVFGLDHCERITIDGPTLSQSTMTIYQGRVVAADDDHCEWRPDSGYPKPDRSLTKFPGCVNVIDPTTGRFKPGLGDTYDAPMTAIGDDYRLTFRHNRPAVGDVLVGRFGDANGKAPFKVHLVDCRDCTIRHVTMSRNGFSPIREEGGGGNHILDCIWEPGPKPDGATAAPLVHSAADGLHSTGADPGPDIERCVMRGAMLDDCIAVHGSFAEVTAVDGRKITLKKGSAGLKAGQPARFCGRLARPIVEAAVASVGRNPDGSAEITLDADVSVDIGDKVWNPRSCGPGFRIIDCTLGNTRSRGILVKADDGVIRGNVIDGCVMSAVSAGPEYYWNEAGYVRNLLIEKNDIRGCGLVPGGDAAVLIHGEGAYGNRHVVINGNQIAGCRNVGVRVEWSTDVSIAGNSFVGSGSAGTIKLTHARDVKADDNQIVNPSGFKTTDIVKGDDVR